MASTTARYPVKAKSLTLLELCQTINEIRNPSSRNTAQILTRRLYLHPLTISTNAKQYSLKVISNNVLEMNQTNLEKKHSSFKRKSYHDLSLLSSSFPLTTRTNTKLNSTITTDHDNSNVFELSTTTISTNSISLPPINRGISSSLSKRTVSTRSSCIPIQQKPNKNRWEKVDVWRNLAHALQRPTPKDPPTTPLDILLDSELQTVQQPNCNAIQQIQIYKRKPARDSPIDENDNNEEEKKFI
jgi:hypothetical protein